MGIRWDYERVQAAIYEKGMSFGELSRLCGVNASTIYGIFYRNNSVCMDIANPIAEKLGLPARELWKDTTKRLGKKDFPVDLIEMEFRRVELGMTKGQLANKCGWSNSKISDIMNRGECWTAEAVTLAGALEIDVDGLRLR